MKKSILVIASLAFGLFASAQTPPKPVTDNFAKKFSSATKVKWDQEEENEWEAEFIMSGNEMSASFDNAGKWLETEKELKKKDLPANVLKAVEEVYKGWDIEEISSIETPDFKGYELGIEKGKEEMELKITADGKITAKKEAKEGEEKDEK